ncbi:MAG: GNAT family N-acetyltransferase [Candidatus Paceibacterota bacterium]|jgi:ribosomal protein S18 acetylase RimI-like enzyme
MFSIFPVRSGLFCPTSNFSVLLAEQWISLYCEIWKEPPWNEFFWRHSAVKADFIRELSLLHGQGFLAIDPDLVVLGERSVIGFTHGYSVSMYEMRIIAGSGFLNSFFKCRERVYYIDELGVAKEYRGKGISLRLTRLLVDSARSNGLDCVLLRTDTKAVPARGLYYKLGFTELTACDAKYPDRTYWSLKL